ncbi:Cullin binding-domain-containing protein [Geopyxis carbonaria]|nr:Cullin binding-domain-containing protein [Geopyxis carbonaria]
MSHIELPHLSTQNIFFVSDRPPRTCLQTRPANPPSSSILHPLSASPSILSSKPSRPTLRTRTSHPSTAPSAPMNYTSTQQSAIQQLIAFTSCSERQAVKSLKKCSWDVAVAADSYFNGGSGSSSGAGGAKAPDAAALHKIFDDFRGPADPADTIGINGTMAYLEALGVGLEEPTVLVLAEALRAPTMGEFERGAFVAGWQALRIDSLERMRSHIPVLRTEYAADEAQFKKVYMFAYGFALSSPAQKSLPLDVAVEYWRLLLRGRFDDHLDAWITFLETRYRKSIARDTWRCMYEFVLLAKKDGTLGGYDVNGAWPSILDDFVNYYRSENGMDTTG